MNIARIAVLKYFCILGVALGELPGDGPQQMAGIDFIDAHRQDKVLGDSVVGHLGNWRRGGRFGGRSCGLTVVPPYVCSSRNMCATVLTHGGACCSRARR